MTIFRFSQYRSQPFPVKIIQANRIHRGERSESDLLPSEREGRERSGKGGGGAERSDLCDQTKEGLGMIVQAKRFTMSGRCGACPSLASGIKK
jgi:hypothetical protein